MTGFTIKICGLSTPETIDVALEAGADMIGLVFHPKSPRFVTDEVAHRLAEQARGRAMIVALVVDFDDGRLDMIASATSPDLWQLHGREDASRCRRIATLWDRPVMKAVGWSSGQPGEIALFEAVAGSVDRLLIDAKPPKDAAYPGGHGRAFDWTTLRALAGGPAFMLSGGLHPGNVADAIRTVRALGCDLAGVDVSSGVESSPGVKDPSLIRDFIAAARAAASETTP
jgi:phosphoribosylanthranilate isomerase